MTVIAHTHDAHQSAKQSLVNSTAAASNASSAPSDFDAILSALGLRDDSETSPAIPTASPQTTANNGAAKPSGESVLAAKVQKSLEQKGLKSLKVLTPDQAAQLAAQAQNPQAQAVQAALASSLASNPQPSSSGWSAGSAISSVESAIKSGLTGVVDLISGRSAGNSGAPAVPPLAAPVVAVGGNAAQAKAQAQAAASTATAANSEALEMALAQATAADSAQDPNAASSTMDAAALQGARITAAKNPTSDQMAASKQQAFADLKPTADVKATETQALAPDAGLSKPDSKDAGAKSDGGNDKDNAQPSVDTASTPDGQQPANSQAPQQGVTFAAQVADNASANAAATAGATTPVHSALGASTSGVSVAPSADQSAAMKLDTGSLAISIAAKSIEGAKQFDIRLDPPELGRVDVKLSVDAAGKAQAHLTVEKPATLDMLQRDSGTLQRSLKESGVNLANNGLQFSLRNQQQSASALPQAPRSRALTINAVPVVAPISTHGYAHGHARLDIRV